MSDVATTERVEEILVAVPIFSRLNSRDLKKLAKLCVPKTFTDQQTIIEEGATGLGLFVITSGRVQIFKGSGDERTILGEMEEGDVLGEISLIDDRPRSASAITLTATDCLLLTRDSFETLVKKEPEIAWCIVPGLAERVRELHARALEAEERLSSAAPRPEAEKASTAAASNETETDAETEADDEDKGSEAWENMARTMRMPYGMMVGGLTGLSSMIKLWETFFTKLADETDLRDSDSFSEILDKAPDGFVAASREAISEMESVPQEMVDSFRNIYKED